MAGPKRKLRSRKAVYLCEQGFYADAIIHLDEILLEKRDWVARERLAMLEGALPYIDPKHRATIGAFVEQCRGHLGPDSQPLGAR